MSAATRPADAGELAPTVEGPHLRAPRVPSFRTRILVDADGFFVEGPEGLIGELAERLPAHTDTSDVQVKWERLSSSRGRVSILAPGVEAETDEADALACAQVDAFAEGFGGLLGGDVITLALQNGGAATFELAADGRWVQVTP